MNDDPIDRLLAGTDPAASLPDLTPDQIHDFTEDALSSTTRTLTFVPSPAHRSRPRRRLVTAAIALAAAAAVAALVVPTALGVGSSGTTALRLAPALGIGAQCAPVSTALLTRADIAFRGQVTAISDGTVTLHVLHRYTGDVEDTVTIPQGTRGDADGSAIVFVLHEDYLVAATESTVGTCGTTGLDSPDLRSIYTRAFGA